MNENEYSSSLKARDIRPTALRVLILRTMAGFDRAFSLADLEEELDTVDKSTLFPYAHSFSGASLGARHRRRYRFAQICALQQRLRL